MIKRGLILSATAVAVAAVTVTGAGMQLSRGQAFFQESPKELVDEVWQAVDRTYVDATFNQVDWRAVRQDYLNREYSSSEEAYTAIREMLAKLEDPYTRFMDPEEFESMRIETQGQLSGVGITLSQDEETKELIVVSPIEGSPAAEAGIVARDVIAKIDGESTEGMDINAAVSRIRGEEGTQVTLTIRRGNRELEVPLTRANIELRPVRYTKQTSPQGDIGYIRLTQFNDNASEEMQKAIEDLESQNVNGYILDLRSNPGGLLDASVDISRMWYDEGVIVSTVNRQGISQQYSANNTALTDKPLVVLVDKGSASASEILSGALQDNDRGTLVGTETFGKGLVQSVRGLSDGRSGLAITVAKYLTPSGRDINHAGIKPDVVIELTDAQREELASNNEEIGTPQDPQYVRALDVLSETIASGQSSSQAAQ